MQVDVQVAAPVMTRAMWAAMTKVLARLARRLGSVRA